jgi:predicted dehydrogenase
VLNELPGAKISAICEVSPERLRKAVARYPHVSASADAEELNARVDLDAVVISTSASTHYELARRALESGKHVLVEKPIALRVDHGEELATLAERLGRVLMVGHTFIYNAGIRKMKECVRCTDFGRIYYLHATRTNLGPIRHDVNAVWDLAPHDVSIFNYFLDERPQWVSAVGSRVLASSREDVAFLTLGYSNGVIGNIHVSWADPNKVREVVAVGSARRVVFDDLSALERVRIFEKGVSVGEMDAQSFGEFKLLVRDGDIISPRIEASEPLKNQCEEFLECVRTGVRPLTDAQFATDVVRVLVAADASLRANGQAKEIP